MQDDALPQGSCFALVSFRFSSFQSRADAAAAVTTFGQVCSCPLASCCWATYFFGLLHDKNAWEQMTVLCLSSKVVLMASVVHHNKSFMYGDTEAVMLCVMGMKVVPLTSCKVGFVLFVQQFHV